MKAERKGLTVDKQQKNLVVMRIVKGLKVGEQQKNQAKREMCIVATLPSLFYIFMETKEYG